MALINCPECKKQISDKAPTCPHCGYSAAPATQPFKPARATKQYGCGTVIVLIIIGTILFKTCSSSAPAPQSLQQTTPPPTPATTERTPQEYLNAARAHFEKSSNTFAKNQIAELLKKHPNTSEALAAKDLLNTIEIAEKAAAEEKLKLATAAVKPLAKKSDEVTGVTWLKPKNIGPLGTHIFTYIGTHPDRQPILRVQFHYESENWLFVNAVTIVIDGKKIGPTAINFKRDHSSGTIWETSDERASEEDTKMLQEIAESQKTIIRFNGRDYYDDHIVSKNEKRALKEVLNAYNAIK